MKLPHLVLLAGLSFASFGCASKCDTSNCTGCCDPSGECQAPSASACGQGGAVCQQCLEAQTCVEGACQLPGGNGGNGANGGTGTGTLATATGSVAGSNGSSGSRSSSGLGGTSGGATSASHASSSANGSGASSGASSTSGSGGSNVSASASGSGGSNASTSGVGSSGSTSGSGSYTSTSRGSTCDCSPCTRAGLGCDLSLCTCLTEESTTTGTGTSGSPGSSGTTGSTCDCSPCTNASLGCDVDTCTCLLNSSSGSTSGLGDSSGSSGVGNSSGSSGFGNSSGTTGLGNTGTTGLGTSGNTGGDSTGSSGSTGALPNTLVGLDAFAVATSIDLFYLWPDAGVIPNEIQVVMTDDSTDSCPVDVVGYADGGLPPTETNVVEITVVDPSANGIQAGVAYTSLTEGEELNYAMDGGGLPATAFSQVLVYAANGDVLVSSSGTVTYSLDPTTQEVDATFEVADFNLYASTITGLLSGNAVPPSSCEVGITQ